MAEEEVFRDDIFRVELDSRTAVGAEFMAVPVMDTLMLEEGK